MTDPAHARKPDPGTHTPRGAPPAMPRWVKVAAIIAAILVLALVAILVLGGEEHGPSRHATDGQPGEQIWQTRPAGDGLVGGHG